MRGRTLYGGWLGACLLALAPALAHAQQYAPADPQIPIPFGSTRPEDGGLFTSGRMLLIRQSNPLRSQAVAVRGLFAYDTGGRTVLENRLTFLESPDGVTLQALLPTDQPFNGFDTGPLPANSPGGIVIAGGISTTISVLGIPSIVTNGQFVIREFFQVLDGLFDQPGFFGSNELALDVEQLRRRAPYQPGVELGVGWKFRDGSSVSLNWMYISEVQQRAGATLAPPTGINPGGANPNINIGDQLANTFLFAPVFNFPPEYAGADFKVNAQGGTIGPGGNEITANPQTAFGIWNAASIMTIEFRQRFQQWEIVYREPIWETENYRLNGLVGPRFSWIWERFKWTTTSIGQNNDGTVTEGPQYVGIYNNITSNRMYGVHAGCEQEWYLGHGFAFHLKTEGALFLNSVKERAAYETAAKKLGMPSNKIAKREWSVVPELQAQAGLMWYPYEFIQVYAGYDFWAFFNTRASPRPISFDYSNIDPRWTHVNRLFDGCHGGVAFTW